MFNRILNRDQAIVLKLSEVIGMSQCRDLRRELATCLKECAVAAREHAERSQILLISFDKVRLADSSVIATIAEAYQLARAQGVKFGLVALNGPMTKLLKVFRLDTVFPTYATLDQALADG